MAALLLRTLHVDFLIYLSIVICWLQCLCVGQRATRGRWLSPSAMWSRGLSSGPQSLWKEPAEQQQYTAEGDRAVQLLLRHLPSAGIVRYPICFHTVLGIKPRTAYTRQALGRRCPCQAAAACFLMTAILIGVRWNLEATLLVRGVKHFLTLAGCLHFVIWEPCPCYLVHSLTALLAFLEFNFLSFWYNQILICQIHGHQELFPILEAISFVSQKLSNFIC